VTTVEFKNALNAGVAIGAGEFSVLSISPYLSSTSRIGPKFSMDARVNYVYNTGNGISVAGFGDAFLNLNYHPTAVLSFSAGMKGPISRLKGNKQVDGKSLPMDYQTTLGTLDLIVGLRYNVKKLLFVLAFQQPLTQNENTYMPEVWEPDSILASFPITNGFQRKADVVARIAYPFQLSNKLNLTAGLVPIYHLDEDQYRNSGGALQPIIGSDGLTLNASLYFEWRFSERRGLGVNMGFPLVVRKARPDGLTRSFVLGVEYQLRR
ncbi:MAG: hypothetical protein M3R25_15050, partial [Bacteroidota bacterium]|nr:hypothetical protein [Bacteroidota bacterium]